MNTPTAAKAVAKSRRRRWNGVAGGGGIEASALVTVRFQPIVARSSQSPLLKCLLSPFGALAAPRPPRRLVMTAPSAVGPARSRSPTCTIEGKLAVMPAKDVLADETHCLAVSLDDSSHRRLAAPKPITKMPASARIFAPMRRERRISILDRCEWMAARQSATMWLECFTTRRIAPLKRASSLSCAVQAPGRPHGPGA